MRLVELYGNEAVKRIKEKEEELRCGWDGLGEPWCVFMRDGSVALDENGKEIRGRGGLVLRYYNRCLDATRWIRPDDSTSTIADLKALKKIWLERANDWEEGYQEFPDDSSFDIERRADLPRECMQGRPVTHFHPDEGHPVFSKGDFYAARIMRTDMLLVFSSRNRYYLRIDHERCASDEMAAFEQDLRAASCVYKHAEWWEEASRKYPRFEFGPY